MVLFSGVIPVSVSSLSLLLELHLFENQLTGEIDRKRQNQGIGVNKLFKLLTNLPRHPIVIRATVQSKVAFLPFIAL